MSNNSSYETSVVIKTELEGDGKPLKLADDLTQLGKSAGDTAPEFQALANELRSITDQQALIDRFKALKTETVESGKAADAARLQVESLAREMTASKAPSAQLASNLEKARTAAKDSAAVYERNTADLSALRKEMQDNGISTTNLAEKQRALTAGVASVSQRTTELKTAYDKAGSAAQGFGGASEQAANKATASHKQISKGVDSISKQLADMRTQLIGLFAAGQVKEYIQDIGALQEEYRTLQNAVRNTLTDQSQLNAVYGELFNIAQRSSTEVGVTVELFTRINDVGKDLNLTTKDALDLTETLSKAVQNSGGGAAATETAIKKLTLAIQTGELGGKQFVAMLNEMPPLAGAMANAFGVSRKELLKLAQDGQISAAQFIRALKDQAQNIDAEYQRLPASVGRSFQSLKTEFLKLVGGMSEAGDSTAYLAKGIDLITGHLNELVGVATRAGAFLVAALAVQAVGAFRAYTAEAVKASAATSVFSASINKIPKNVSIAVAFTGLEVGWQIGTWLQDNFAWARKLGVALTGYGEAVFNTMVFYKEAIGALFSRDDSVSKAFDRYKKQMTETRSIISDMWTDAETKPQQAADATDAAMQQTAQSAQHMGDAVSGASNTAASGISSVGSAAATAKSAIQGLAQSAGVQLDATSQTAQALALSLAEAAKKSAEVAEKIGKGLPDAVKNLSGSQLKEFLTSFTAGMSAARDATNLTARAVRAVSERAAQALGVDLATVSTTLSSQFVDAQNNLALLISKLPDLQRQGVDTGNLLKESLSKMIDGAKNQAELDALRRRIEALGPAALGSQRAVEALLDQTKAKAALLIAPLDELTSAFKTLGITTQQESQRIAENFKHAYEAIRDSDSAIEKKKEAFVKYAEAAIAANKGVADSTIATQAAIYGLKTEVDGLGRVTGISMGKAKDAFDSVGDAADATKPKIRDVKSVLDEAYNAADATVRKMQEAINLKEKMRGSGGSSGGVQNLPSGLSDGQLSDLNLTAKEKEDYLLNNNLSADERAAGLVKRSVNTQGIDAKQIAFQRGLSIDEANAFEQLFGDIYKKHSVMAQQQLSGTPIMSSEQWRDTYNGQFEQAIQEAMAAATAAVRKNNASNSGSGSGSSSGSGSGSGSNDNQFPKNNTYQVNINLPDGGTKPVKVNSQDDATALIQALQTIAART